MIKHVGLVLGAIALLAMPAAAKGARDLDLKAFEADWKACEQQVASHQDGSWIGWHRDFGNGYGDNFEFYDGRLDQMASALKVSRFIDGIAGEFTTWCYRGDGSLDMIAVSTGSPDMMMGGEMGAQITREGRLYFDAQGQRLAIRGWLTDADGNKIGLIDSAEHQLARGCNPVDLRLRADDAEAEYVSELGDIDGNRPAYAPNALDWCAVAEEGP
ncbi:hypothetical protein ABIB57_003393 [Devosia sp. UYZn731]|uniref:hypothetical protein n=1 Tax=Devosia sp. UYZn731 TaxID=3156345 RepID=UPI003395FCDD